MKKSGRLPFLIVIAAALAAGAAAAGISTLLMKRVVNAEPSKPQKVEIVPITFMYPLGEQIVNLLEPGRFLKVGIELEILAKGSPKSVEQKASANHSGGHGEPANNEKPLPPVAASTKAELDEKRSKILDAVIEELSRSSFRELLTPQGKRNLRERIKKAVNKMIESGEVQHVYFTTFLAQ
ncbi:MAG: flagellar basal body-associated FliL family protein [Armatimonadetes bacterium]|nr:flagellar basal body-associated FliL family protein [Armatimonadota bacterium]MDW8027465.1 flagellar basal body-associated FliL family protein [Armatimonadota bacterium]